jgi:hypothetical protein
MEMRAEAALLSMWKSKMILYKSSEAINSKEFYFLHQSDFQTGIDFCKEDMIRKNFLLFFS